MCERDDTEVGGGHKVGGKKCVVMVGFAKLSVVQSVPCDGSKDSMLWGGMLCAKKTHSMDH